LGGPAWGKPERNGVRKQVAMTAGTTTTTAGDSVPRENCINNATKTLDKRQSKVAFWVYEKFTRLGSKMPAKKFRST